MQKQRLLWTTTSVAGCLLVGGGVGWTFATKSNLYMNGSLASTHVFEHNGVACAPIADVAKAMGQSVVSRADGYAIVPAGGANQVSGVTGKVGETLSNGQFTLTVVKVIRTGHYIKQFDTGDASPDNAAHELVEVVCRIKNALPKTTATVSIFGGGNTALTDQDSHSLTAGRFASDFASAGPSVLPGAATDFALGFNVVKGAKLGDFIYQMNVSGGPTNLKDTTFRVSLASVGE